MSRSATVQGRAPYSRLRQVVPIVLLALAAQLVLATLVGVGLVFLDQVTQRKTEARALSIAVVNLLGFWTVLWFATRRAGLALREALPLRLVSPVLLLPMALTVVGLHIVLSEVDNAIERVLPAPDWMAQLFGGPNDLGGERLVLAVVGLVAPLTEEPLFRGLLLRGLLGRFRRWPAIAWTAALFAAVHLNLWQAPGALLLGVLFGWWAVRTGSLVPSLLGHAFANVWSGIATTWLHWDQIPGYANARSQPIQWQPWWFDGTGVLLALAGIVGTYLLLARLDVRPLAPLPLQPVAADDAALARGGRRGWLRESLLVTWWLVGVLAYGLLLFGLLALAAGLTRNQPGQVPTVVAVLVAEVVLTLLLLVTRGLSVTVRYVAPLLLVGALVFFAVFRPPAARQRTGTTPARATVAARR